jgi:probable phosphoglycerate mutase
LNILPDLSIIQNGGLLFIMIQRILFPAICLMTVFQLSYAQNPLEGLPPIQDGETRLFIIRHAETFHNIDHSMTSESPEYYRITLRGKKQAAALGELLKDQPIAKIFTSQMTRAKETLKFMEMPNNFEVVDDKAFNFMKLGLNDKGESNTFADRIAIWEQNTDPIPQDGESLSYATKRFISRLRAEDAEGKAVVVISHGDVVAGLIGSAEGLNPWHRWEEAGVPVGSLTVIDMKKDGPLYVHVKGFDPVE